jgi:hypothetical protein
MEHSPRLCMRWCTQRFIRKFENSKYYNHVRKKHSRWSDDPSGDGVNGVIFEVDSERHMPRSNGLFFNKLWELKGFWELWCAWIHNFVPPGSVSTKPEHGQPGPMARPGSARKWPGSTSYFGPTGQAWADKSGPIDKTGRAWAAVLGDLEKAQRDDPTIFWPDGPGLGRKNTARQSGRDGPG